MKAHVYHFAPVKLDVAAMREAGRFLTGRHDFSSFKKTGSARKRSNIRTINEIRVSKKGNLIFIDVTGEGFLYKMVRGIAGTLIEIGRRKLPIDSVKKILRARNRIYGGPTAPACGLCLTRVKYGQ